MAYFRGNATQLDRGSVSLSGKNGYITIKPSEANSSLMMVHSPKGKKYGIWMQEANDSMVGMNMFPRYAMKLVISNDIVHLWIKRFASGRSRGTARRNYVSQRSANRGYGGGRMWQPMNYNNNMKYSGR